jgi:hypothetical protein
MTIDFTNPAGKGAQPRPFSDYEQYKTNWDLIFGKKNSQGSDDKGSETHDEVVKEQQDEVDKQEVKD